MKAVQKYVLLLGALGFSACGMFQAPPPAKPTSPTTETTPNTDFGAQGTPIVCTNQSAGGNFPYNSNGPLWRQQFFLNDNGTPLNYSTFSTDLPAVGNISMNPYVVNATGGTYTPGPWMYQYIYAPNVILTGTQTNGAAANNIVVTASGNHGLSYNASLKQFDLPVVSSSNKFKLYDAAGNLLPTEYGGSQTSMPSINGRVRIPTGQKVTLEFYLDPKVQYRPELIWANFKDASGVSKTDWVKVTMPYQEGILKVNAATYTVQESTGIKTYQSATNPLPKFKFVMRGYNNLVSSDRQFMNRQGIYYAWPSSVPSGNWTAYNQFMDERKDFVLNWNLYDQKVGSATVDASGDPVLNAATVSTAAQWNLGTPGYANDKNCISKTLAPESGVMQRFSVIQPKAVVLSTSTFTETQQGLKAEFFDNPDFTGKRVERLNSQINFNWGGYSPAPYISPETYSIRWSGSITPAFNETYTFTFSGGSGVRVRVNHKTIIDQWDTPSAMNTGTIALRRGAKFDLQVEYKHLTGNASAKLEWQSPSQSREMIPARVLSPIGTTLLDTNGALAVPARFTVGNDVVGATTVLSYVEEKPLTGGSQTIRVWEGPEVFTKARLLSANGQEVALDFLLWGVKDTLAFNRANTIRATLMSHLAVVYFRYPQKVQFYQFLLNDPEVQQYIAQPSTEDIHVFSTRMLNKFLKPPAISKQTVTMPFPDWSLIYINQTGLDEISISSHSLVSQRFFVFKGEKTDFSLDMLNAYSENIMCDPEKNCQKPYNAFLGMPAPAMTSFLEYALHILNAGKDNISIKVDPPLCGKYTVVASAAVRNISNLDAKWQNDPMVDNVGSIAVPLIKSFCPECVSKNGAKVALEVLDVVINDFMRGLRDAALEDVDLEGVAKIVNVILVSAGKAFIEWSDVLPLESRVSVTKMLKMDSDGFSKSQGMLEYLDTIVDYAQVLSILTALDNETKGRFTSVAQFTIGDPQMFAYLTFQGTRIEGEGFRFEGDATSGQNIMFNLKNIGCMDLEYTSFLVGSAKENGLLRIPEQYRINTIGTLKNQQTVSFPIEFFCDRFNKNGAELRINHNIPEIENPKIFKFDAICHAPKIKITPEEIKVIGSINSGSQDVNYVKIENIGDRILMATPYLMNYDLNKHVLFPENGLKISLKPMESRELAIHSNCYGKSPSFGYGVAEVVNNDPSSSFLHPISREKYTTFGVGYNCYGKGSFLIGAYHIESFGHILYRSLPSPMSKSGEYLVDHINSKDVDNYPSIALNWFLSNVKSSYSLYSNLRIVEPKADEDGNYGCHWKLADPLSGGFGLGTKPGGKCIFIDIN